ncbi:putative manganese-dependent inorganic diphosphatase [bacterium]|nr:putative manganese-dependent inorganic diphosphatase [bacterium]
MEKIYVLGHKKPDTDSIAAAISLSNLKNELGIPAEPRTLGNLNNETKFALDYFNETEPKYLNDVKLQVKDTKYIKNYFLNSNQSIYDGYNYMNQFNIGNLPLISEDGTFTGLISMKDIAKYQMKEELNHLNASYDNILKVLNGESILKFDDNFDIKILTASYRSTRFIETVNIDEKMGLIVGDRHSIIEYAVNNKAKLIVLTGNSEIKDIHLDIAKKNKVNIIRTNYDSFTTSRKIWLSNYLNTIIENQNIICFNEEDTVDDVMDKTKRFKYSNYPIINKDNKCLGLMRISDINDATRKKVILVDHNEAIQSVDGLEEAEIVEIIDHHKIGTLGTSLPINFRNMPLGSSNTIIYLLYKENQIKISKNIAGLMLSGIISDTLLFRSPTTTDIDRKAANELATIAEVDLEKYGMELLKAGSSLKGKSKEDILFMDFKNFTIEDKKVGIGQITTFDISEIESEKEEYVALINQMAENNGYYALALFATDIIKNGSYIYYNEQAKEVFANSFDIDELKEGSYIDGCVSRKKQFIPSIINTIEKK